MTLSTLGDTQDFHDFIDAYRRQYPDDVLTVQQPLSAPIRTSPPWSTPSPPKAAIRC